MHPNILSKQVVSHSQSPLRMVCSAIAVVQGGGVVELRGGGGQEGGSWA